MRTAIDIYRVDHSCQKTYEGTVQLRDSTMLLELSSNRPLRLVFIFQESSLLANSQSSITQETVFQPEPGNRYEFEVSHADKIYGVQMRKPCGVDLGEVAPFSIAPFLPPTIVVVEHKATEQHGRIRHFE